MSFVVVGTVDELSDDIPLPVEVDEVDLAIVRHDGELFAIRDECSHARVPLSEGDVDDCTIECYLHGSRFDLRTGAATNLPATQPVPVFPVRLDGDDICVDIENPITATSFDTTDNQEL